MHAAGTATVELDDLMHIRKTLAIDLAWDAAS
jgi:hypothetical protein